MGKSLPKIVETASGELKKILFLGKMHIISNNQQLNSVFSSLQSVTKLGFDTETRPSFKQGEVYKVALLQLATESEAIIVKLHEITDFAPIIKVLENKNILKVGVAIRDDLKALQKVFKFTPENFVELQTLAKTKGLKKFGLKGMAEDVLQAKLSKSAKLTNWESKHLTEAQLRYAATDAWIGLKLFEVISELPNPEPVSEAQQECAAVTEDKS